MNVFVRYIRTNLTKTFVVKTLYYCNLLCYVKCSTSQLTLKAVAMSLYHIKGKAFNHKGLRQLQNRVTVQGDSLQLAKTFVAIKSLFIAAMWMLSSNQAFMYTIYNVMSIRMCECAEVYTHTYTVCTYMPCVSGFRHLCECVWCVHVRSQLRFVQ